MTKNEVETLEDLGIYFSDWVQNNCTLYDNETIRKIDEFLDDLSRYFNLSNEEKNYISSKIFLQKSQSNEATLKLARMANTIKIKDRRKGK